MNKTQIIAGIIALLFLSAAMNGSPLAVAAFAAAAYVTVTGDTKFTWLREQIKTIRENFEKRDLR